MPENPKCFIHNTTVFISSRTQEDLPLVATPYMEEIIWGILGSAQEKHPLRINHFLFMPNHFHIIATVHNPEDIPSFLLYLKRELGHAINRLLGRKQKTIWCEGYDSPTLLNFEDVLKYINYTYTNPQKANLVETINEYPGVSSWKMYENGVLKRKCKRIPRNAIPKLPKTDMSIQEQKKFAQKLLDKATEEYEFELEPNAWMECFPETLDSSEIKNQITARIQESESTLKEERTQPVLGSKTLKLRPIDTPYSPQKFGKRMICICHRKELRIAYIQWFKEQVEKARAAYQKFKTGDSLALPPPGFFTPGGSLKANIVPFAFQFAF